MPEDIEQLVTVFVSAPSWAASQRLVAAEPRLLGDDAEQVLARLADGPDERIYRIHLELLRACRRDGIETAFRQVVLHGVPASLHPRWLAAADASERYQQQGGETDLAEAVDALTALVDDAAFLDAPGDRRALMAYALGTAAIDRYAADGDAEDLRLAGRGFSVAVDASPPGDSELPNYLAAVGNVRALSYELIGDLADLRASVVALDAAVALLDVDDPWLPIRLGELSASYGTLYDETADAVDLAAAIEAGQRAVRIAEQQPDDSDLAGLLNNLTNSLVLRYERGGDLDDLRAATGLARRAVELGSGTPYEPRLLATLGGVLQLRYERDRNLGTLDRAIAALAAAAAALPDSPDRAVGLGGLAAARVSRFEASGDSADLATAVSEFTVALRLVEPSGPRAAVLRGGLGLALLRRGEPAVEILESAVGGAAGVERILPYLLQVLGGAYREAGNVGAASATFRRALRHGLETQVEIALQVGAEWGRWAAGRGAWAEAVEALDGALDAAGRLLRTQFSRPDKEVWLGEASGLAARAAYAAVHSGSSMTAVVMLEGGRAQLIAEALSGDLASRAPVLAARFRSVNERLRALRWQPPVWSWAPDLDGEE